VLALTNYALTASSLSVGTAAAGETTAIDLTQEPPGCRSEKVAMNGGREYAENEISAQGNPR
jgi:hypothetical protein